MDDRIAGVPRGETAASAARDGSPPLAVCAGADPPHPMNRAWSAGTIDCTRTSVLPGDDPWATACPTTAGGLAVTR